MTNCETPVSENGIFFVNLLIFKVTSLTVSENAKNSVCAQLKLTKKFKQIIILTPEVSQVPETFYRNTSILARCYMLQIVRK